MAVMWCSSRRVSAKLRSNADGTEEQCQTIVIAARWPRGLSARLRWQAILCGDDPQSLTVRQVRRQTSPMRGRSLLDASAAAAWFRAIYHLTQTKQGISSIEWSVDLG